MEGRPPFRVGIPDQDAINGTVRKLQPGSPDAGVDGYIELDRSSWPDSDGLWQVTTADSLVTGVHHIGSRPERDRIAGIGIRNNRPDEDTPAVVMVMGRAAYAAMIWSWEIEQGSTGQSGPIDTFPESVPFGLSCPGKGPPVLSIIATTRVMMIRTMIKSERLKSIPGIVDGWEREEKRIVVGAG